MENPLNLAFARTEAPSALTAEASVNGALLHGSKAPKYVVHEELPWHRHAAFMFAAGETTIKDVAEFCGVDRSTITNLLRQPWFQERVTALMAERGGRDIMQLFRAEQFNCLVTLVQLRDDEATSKRDRITCAKDILDRALGKPTQRVETVGQPSSENPTEEVARLERELHGKETVE